jgi:hypothetical protein
MRPELLSLQKPLPSEEEGWNRMEETYGNKDAPLRDYAGLIVLFAVVAGGLVFARKRSLPEKIGLNDLLLLGLATQKVSRVVTKSRVASVVRAPFTRYEGSAGAGEVEERPRGRGLRRAIGELVSCPFCMGTWIACASIAGLVSHPRLVRTVASIFAVGSIADFIQQAYCRMKEANDQDDRV